MLNSKMAETRLILCSLLTIFIVAKSDATAVQSTSTSSSEQSGLSPSTLNTVKSTSKTIGSKITELFLNHFLPSNSFTLLITNNMVKRRMIDPKIYLKNGATVFPPSFVLPAAEEPFGGVRHIVMLENDPAGVLCYDSEPIAAEDRSLPKAVSCVIFDAKEKQFAVYGQYTAITNVEIQALYTKFAAKSDPQILPVRNKNGRFLLKEYAQFQILAQMTTSQVRELHFEARDSVSSAQAVAQKRTVMAIASSLLLGSLSTLATFTFSRITADVGTTLTLENESSETVPIVLEDPRWEQNGVKIQDIIPWRLASKESCKLNFVAPFASGKTFKRSAIVLSFEVQGTNYRVVLSIWWPKKLNLFSKDLNSYSVSWLPVPSSTEGTDILSASLQDLVRKTDESDKFPTPVIQIDNFQRYQFWQFPIVDPQSKKVEKFLNVLTIMGNGRKNGMTVKVYGSLPPPNTEPPNTIAPPKFYTGLPAEIPPM